MLQVPSQARPHSAANLSCDRKIAGLFFAIALVVYAATSAPQVLGGDSGEFATLAATGGVAHPPGYPLYVLLLRALRWIPALEPAHRASLISALVGAIACGLLYRAARAWGASPIASAIATVTFTFAPLTWHLATCPEVFSLNALVAIILVLLAARTPEDPRAALRQATLLALVAGLGVSNHHSIVLVVPIGLFAWLVAARASKRPYAALLLSLGALAAGLLPYAYLMYAARTSDPATTWLWGDTKTLGGLVAHFLRREYGTTQLGLSNAKPEVIAQVVTFLKATLFELRGIPILGLLGLALATKRGGKIFQWRWLMLLASVLLSGPLFLMRFNIPPRGIGAGIAERFYLLPWTLLLVACARALDSLAIVKMRRVRWLAPAAFAAVASTTAFESVREHHRPTVAHYVRNALNLVEPNAILVGGGDHRFGAFLYARLALGLRKDVAFVHGTLMLSTWYPPQADALVGRSLTRAENHLLSGGRLIGELLATRRPVYLTDWVVDDFRKTLPTYPIGPLIRVAPQFIPLPEEVYLQNDNAYAHFELEPSPPRNMDSWEGDLFSSYARPWKSLADAFQTTNATRAETCRRRAAAFSP